VATPLSLRKQIAHLTLLAKGDLDELFRRVSDARSPELRAALMDVLPSLVETYGAAASSVAADWYDELRAEAAARGRFSAIPADLGDTRVGGLIGWAMEQAKSDDAFQQMIAGGMQKRIANASRSTVARSSYADPQSVGWKRIGVGECGFCAMLIDRDQLYSEATADFASHEHCNCQAYPLIKGAEPIDVKKYVKSSRYIEDDALRAKEQARVKEWIATH
jgi:hypothetical protein